MKRGLIVVCVVTIIGVVVTTGIAIDVVTAGELISTNGSLRFPGALFVEDVDNLAYSMDLYGTLAIGIVGALLSARRHEWVWLLLLVATTALAMVGLWHRYMVYPYYLMYPRDLVFDTLPLLTVACGLGYALSIDRSQRHEANPRMQDAHDDGAGV